MRRSTRLLAMGRSGPPQRSNLLAWYRGQIDDGKLIAYRPVSNHTTQQVKGSAFTGAGTGACTGLLTSDTITAGGGTAPTCSVNGTLTISADCWDVYVHRAGVLWAYWPGINVGQAMELDASGNGHHLTITTTTITERLDGSGTDWCNELGYSDRENVLAANPTSSSKISATYTTDGYYSLSKITADAGQSLNFYPNASHYPATSTSYTFRVRLRALIGSATNAVAMGFYHTEWSGHAARIISGPGSVVVAAFATVSGLSLTEDTVVEVRKNNFVVGVTNTAFYLYAAGVSSTRVGDGCVVKEVQVCVGDFPDVVYAPINTAKRRVSVSSQGGYPLSLGSVICVGDSLTAGYLAPIRLIHPLSTFTSAGVGGDTSAMVLARFYTAVVAVGGDHCMLLVGINDVFGDVPIETTMANISACVDIATANGVGITLSELSPCGNHASWTEEIQTKIEGLNSLINAYGLANGIRVAQLYGGMLAAGTDDLLASYDNGDGLHFNATGSANQAWLFSNALLVELDGSKDIMGYATQYPGPLGLDATVVSGTTLSDAVIKAPLGPEFQAIAEWTNNASVDLAVLAPTARTRIGPRGVLIYDEDLSAADQVKADKYLGVV